MARLNTATVPAGKASAWLNAAHGVPSANQILDPAPHTWRVTWLGAAPHIPNQAVVEGETYGAQADAVLYLGPGEVLTASRAEPTIYEVGAYRDQLRRLSILATAATGQHVDYVAEGPRRAQLPPSFFAQ
jgi:hypothetical protein